MNKTITLFSISALAMMLLPALAFASDFCNAAKNMPCSEFSSSETASKLEDCPNIISQVEDRCRKELKQAREKLEESGKELKETKSQKNYAENVIENMKWEIKETQSKIAELNLTISKLKSEIKNKKEKIDELESKLSKNKKILRKTIRKLYEYKTTSYIEVLLGYGSLSDFGARLREMHSLQQGLRSSVKEIRKAKSKIEKQKNELEKKKQEKVETKKMQKTQKQTLAVQKNRKQSLVENLEGKESVLEQRMTVLSGKLNNLKSAMGAIKQYLSKWTLEGNLSWSNIFSAVENTSSKTGVRPALLLGVLQMESRFATGIGTSGNYQERCSAQDWEGCDQVEALEQICDKYGYNPSEVPMSSACAIGPTQFLPCVWEAYGNGGNPWNFNDAVMASANYLAANGAAAGNEAGAVLAYNQSDSYKNDVLASAEEWQNVIDTCGFNLDCPKMKQRLQEKFGDVGSNSDSNSD